MIRLSHETAGYIHRRTFGSLSDRYSSYELINAKCAVLCLTCNDVYDIDDRLDFPCDAHNIKLILPIRTEEYIKYRQTVKDINNGKANIEPKMISCIAKQLIDDHKNYDTTKPDTGVTISYETETHDVFVHLDPCRSSLTSKDIDMKSFITQINMRRE